VQIYKKENFMRIVSLLLTVVMTTSIALAQQSVPPPPQPAPDKPAGPSLEVTMKFIQDKVNQQGKIDIVFSGSNTVTGQSILPEADSLESRVIAVDPAGGLSVQESHKSPRFMQSQEIPLGAEFMRLTKSETTTWQVYFKDVEKLEVLNSNDFKHRNNPSVVFHDDPPYVDVLVHLATGKTVPRHTVVRVEGGKTDKTTTTESDDSIRDFVLHFRDEETAERVAKAIIHAVELCGGGSKPELF
jgi:hypothetical protein